MRKAALFLLALGAAGFLWAGCGKGRGGRLDSVVLITLDTLRADHVSCYGSKVVNTPHLDRLARQGVRATRTWTTIPLTTPAHASILTGLYPPTHGVRNNARFRLPQDVETLAEVLQRDGVKTGGFVSSFTTSSMFGLAQGFDEFDDDLGNEPSGSPSSQRRGDETLVNALAWLEKNSSGPFFLWLHLFDPHTPYNPPPEFKRLAGGNAYGGEVVFTDALVGRLLDALDRLGVSGRTVVVAVADHGEGLRTHGEEEHGLLLYEETVHVPLILRAPGAVAPGTLATQVTSIVDIYPTLLKLLGRPVPPGLPGEDLLAPERTGPPRQVYAETLYPFEEFGWSALYGLREADRKLIESSAPELYDLAADPREGRNLAGEQAPLRSRLLGSLEALAGVITDTGRLAAAAGFEGATDSETASRLESLGYATGGGAAGSAEGDGPLPARQGRNPREAMEDYDRFQRALDLTKAGQPKAAAEILEKLIRAEPANPQYLLKLAAAWDAAGNDQAAEKAYRDLVTRQDTFYLGYRSFSTFLERKNRYAESRDLWQKLLTRLPGYVGVEVRLAQAEIGAGQAPEAQRRMEALLKKNPQDPEAWTQLGRSRAAQDDGPGALEAFRRALALRPTLREAVEGSLKILQTQGARDEERRLLEGLLLRAPRDPYLHQKLKTLQP